MSQQVVNVGTIADDHTGDPGRTAFQKVNANFTELYAGGLNSIKAYGALGDGVTDDYAAIVSALASGVTSLFVPSANYRLSAGITIPNGIRVYSEGFIAGSPAAGCRFTFDLSVATCVTIGSAGLNSGTLDGITITRAAGSIPAGSIGILVNTGYNISASDVLSDRHAIPWKFYASAPNGIAAMLSRCYSSGATDAHIEIDGWPELRWSQGRIGANGSNNFACDSYIRFKNTAAGATYPNGSFFESVQFNQGGGGAPSYWLNFSVAGTSALEYKFTDCHVENLTTAYIVNSASATRLSRLNLKGCTLNTPVPLVALDTTTQINQWLWSSNEISATTFDLSNVTALNELQFVGNTFTGCTATITSSSGSPAPNAVAAFVGNAWFGSSVFTLNGDKWTSLVVIDTASSNSSIVNNTTSTGVVCLSPNQQSIGWAVALSGSPMKIKNVAYTTVLADSGQTIYHTDGTARTYTIDSNANVPYVVGTMIHFSNDASGAVNVTIAITTDTMLLSPGGTTGSRTLAQFGTATAKKVAATRWIIWGNGLT